MSKWDRAEGGQLSVQAWRRAVEDWLDGEARGGGEATGCEPSEPSECARAGTTPRLLAEASNEEILGNLKSVVGAERRSLARVIVYLVEVEERRLHLELACSSMFDFCTRKLGFSEGEAFRRLAAARLVRRLPALLGVIASGRIHLSNLVLLRDLLTETNLDEIVAAASGKTKREVEELVARMAPKPDVRASIRKLPERRSSCSSASTDSSDSSQQSFTTAPTPSSIPSAQLQAISEGRYKVQFTADEALRDKLELARSLMSHKNPTGDLAAIFERAVDLLIEKLSKEKLAKTSRTPRRAKPAAKHGYVTRAARRETFERDGVQCSFVGKNGERCPARGFLEIDHVKARALGGSGEVENLRVFCRAHNHDAAERVFGRAHVEARIARARRSRKRSSLEGDGMTMIAGPGDFCQRKLDATSTMNAPAAPSAAGSLAVETSGAAPEQARDDGAKTQVRVALISLGFRAAEADRALLVMNRSECDERGERDELWRRPIETLVREALDILT